MCVNYCESPWQSRNSNSQRLVCQWCQVGFCGKFVSIRHMLGQMCQKRNQTTTSGTNKQCQTSRGGKRTKNLQLSKSIGTVSKLIPLKNMEPKIYLSERERVLTFKHASLFNRSQPNNFLINSHFHTVGMNANYIMLYFISFVIYWLFCLELAKKVVWFIWFLVWKSDKLCTTTYIFHCATVLNSPLLQVLSSVPGFEENIVTPLPDCKYKRFTPPSKRMSSLCFLTARTRSLFCHLASERTSFLCSISWLWGGHCRFTSWLWGWCCHSAS